MIKRKVNLRNLSQELISLKKALDNVSQKIEDMLHEAARKSERTSKIKLSIRDHIIDVLLRSKRPLHYRKITQQLKKRGYEFHRKDPERSVYIIINRYPRLFEKTKAATYKLRSASIRDYIVNILKQNQMPMHYREITARIEEYGYNFHRDDPERTIYITLNRNPKLFKKTKAATYGLLRWK